MVVADYAPFLTDSRIEMHLADWNDPCALTAYRGLLPRHKLDEVEVVATG